MARGGARPGAGRKKDIPDGIKLNVRGMASVHGKKAIEELARIAFKAEKDETRVAACKELLDRAYGKATQAIEHSGGMTLTHEQVLDELEKRANGSDAHEHAH
jgi:hypothetical protein